MTTCSHCGKPIESAQRQLLRGIEEIERIFKSDASWEYKYDRIFEMSREIKTLIDDLGISFDWYDPDATYEEDVTSYVEALLSKVKVNLESELGQPVSGLMELVERMIESGRGTLSDSYAASQFRLFCNDFKRLIK